LLAAEVSQLFAIARSRPVLAKQVAESERESKGLRPASFDEKVEDLDHAITACIVTFEKVAVVCQVPLYDRNDGTHPEVLLRVSHVSRAPEERHDPKKGTARVEVDEVLKRIQYGV
jgi:hypothetical protein